MSLQRFKVRTALVAKGAVGPPVPVPNTVVKRSCTYNTAGFTSVGRSAAASAVLFFASPPEGARTGDIPPPRHSLLPVSVMFYVNFRAR
jgi:hypothetical protein